MQGGIGRCAKYRDLLWDYEAGRLSDAEAEAVGKHLECCPRCQVEAARCRLALRALRAHRESPVPESRSTWNQLRARLDAPQPRPAWCHAWLAGAAGVTATAVVAVILAVGRMPVTHAPITMSNLGAEPGVSSMAGQSAVAFVAPPSTSVTADQEPLLKVAEQTPPVVPAHQPRRKPVRTTGAPKRARDAKPRVLAAAQPSAAPVDADEPVASGVRPTYVIGTAPDRREQSPRHYVVGAPAGSVPVGAVMEASAW